MDYVSVKKVSQLFNNENFIQNVDELEKNNLIPKRQLYRSGAIFSKGWKKDELHLIGEQISFFKKPQKCKVITVFTTKGGVLKSTMALNLARMSALSNLKTLVIGLDIQGDISNALCENLNHDDTSIDEAMLAIEKVQGLSSFFNNQKDLAEIIQPTNLENLFCISETPELAALNESLSNINRREYWLRDKVIAPLKEIFDLIIFDCSPNWNKLTTNALVACDLLVSPLECKINNFRNFKVFKKFINDFKEEMSLDFEKIYIPSKYSDNKKLSRDIKDWYLANLEECIPYGIAESVLGEEASALKISMLEHQPQNKVAIEMSLVLKAISDKLQQIEMNKESNVHLERSISTTQQDSQWL